MLYQSMRHSLSRREFLKGATVLAGGSLLVACGAPQTAAPEAGQVAASGK